MILIHSTSAKADLIAIWSFLCYWMSHLIYNSSNKNVNAFFFEKSNIISINKDVLYAHKQ